MVIKSERSLENPHHDSLGKSCIQAATENDDWSRWFIAAINPVDWPNLSRESLENMIHDEESNGKLSLSTSRHVIQTNFGKWGVRPLEAKKSGWNLTIWPFFIWFGSDFALSFTYEVLGKPFVICKGKADKESCARGLRFFMPPKKNPASPEKSKKPSKIQKLKKTSDLEI